MIEKDIIKKRLKEFEIMEYIEKVVDKPGYGFTEIQRTPLGEKVIIHTSKPGLIVGRKGSSIRELTEILKNKFGFENPQIEVSEIENPNLNSHSVAKHITHTFQRFGPSRFKYLGYRLLSDIMKAGAVGAEIVISGRGIPSTRSRSWRFSAGHLKKSGDISENYMQRGFAIAHLKSGSIGVKVSILTKDVVLPDHVEVFKKEPEIEEVTEENSPDELIKEVEGEIKTPEPETKKSKKEEIKVPEIIKEKGTEEKKEQIEKELKIDEKEQHIPIKSNEEKIKEIVEKEVPKLEKKESKEKVPSAKELKEKKSKEEVKIGEKKVPTTMELEKKKSE